ncbi:MAG: sugar phosphate isomerase/epimerase [Candidatus Sumerlaeota bacterium]|nr:sugar phosphate isomerase/epimerase [Candidatus Sumerlaeota bacterium]
MTKKPLAVQMWTLRDVMKEVGWEKALREAAKIGYAGVELWFPGEFPPVAEAKAVLAETGLKPVSAHVPFLWFRNEFQKVADWHLALGSGNVTIPNVPGNLTKGPEGWKPIVSDIARIARKCKEAGLRLTYHNHATEFQEKIDGREVHECIFSTIGADLLKAELDTYFLQAVGKSPAEYIRKFRGRVPLLHLKDQNKNPKIMNAEIGRGTIDWKAVFAAADDAGVEWLIVEQNCQELPALESIRASLDYVKAMGAA